MDAIRTTQNSDRSDTIDSDISNLVPGTIPRKRFFQSDTGMPEDGGQNAVDTIYRKFDRSFPHIWPDNDLNHQHHLDLTLPL